MIVTLEKDVSWHGQLYEAGDREIPDALAQALGLEPPKKSDSQPGGESEQSDSVTDSPAPEKRRTAKRV